MGSRLVNTEPSFPLGRIRTIMKSSLETGQISNEVLLLMAKTTEMFVQFLSKESYNVSEGTTLMYKHLSSYIQDNNNLEFLLQIVPQRIKVQHFKQILRDTNSRESSSDGEEDI